MRIFLNLECTSGKIIFYVRFLERNSGPCTTLVIDDPAVVTGGVTKKPDGDVDDDNGSPSAVTTISPKLRPPLETVTFINLIYEHIIIVQFNMSFFAISECCTMYIYRYFVSYNY